MKKCECFLWLLALSFPINAWAQSSGLEQEACCYKDRIYKVEDCCKGYWEKSSRVEYRNNACCYIESEKGAYVQSSSGNIKDEIPTPECCESATGGAQDGSYIAYYLPDSDPEYVCCIKDTWKHWKSGTKRADCCTSLGGTVYQSKCCFGAYDLDEKKQSKECCDYANGVWYDSEDICCFKGDEDKGSSKKKNDGITLQKDGITYKPSGEKRDPICCTKAGGKWIDDFCCITWGIVMPDTKACIPEKKKN